jgi:hypothetical protein
MVGIALEPSCLVHSLVMKDFAANASSARENRQKGFRCAFSKNRGSLQARSNLISGDSIVFHPAMCLKRFDIRLRRRKPDMRSTTDRKGGVAIPLSTRCVKGNQQEIPPVRADKRRLCRGVAFRFASAKHGNDESLATRPDMRAIFLLPALMSSLLAASMSDGAAAAETGVLIDGSDAESILEIARNYGSATVESQASGNPKISARIGGISYAIYFQNCTTPRDCKDLNFYAGFLDGKLTEAHVNAWNAGKRFGRAYIDPDGDAALEMDINLDGGTSPTNLSTGFAIWRLMLIQFTDYLKQNG